MQTPYDRNITTQPGEIDDRKYEVIAFVVNAAMNFTGGNDGYIYPRTCIYVNI